MCLMWQIHKLSRGFQESLQARLFDWFSLESNVFSGIFFRNQNLKQRGKNLILEIQSVAILVLLKGQLRCVEWIFWWNLSLGLLLSFSFLNALPVWGLNWGEIGKYRFFLGIRGQSMRSFNPSPLRVEVTQFRFFNHNFERNKCSGNTGYELLEIHGLGSIFFQLFRSAGAFPCCWWGRKIEIARKISQILENELVFESSSDFGSCPSQGLCRTLLKSCFSVCSTE